jgi:two-component system sensor histidine kinase KdpD
MLIVGLVISQLAGELNTKIRDVQLHASNSKTLYELATKLNSLDRIDEQKQYFIERMNQHLKINCQWKKVSDNGQGDFFLLSEKNEALGGFSFLKRLSDGQKSFARTAISLLYQVHEKTLLRQQSAASAVQTELERAKNALLRSISHDLRTPLTTIMGASSMLADDNITLSNAVIKEQAGNIFEQSKILNQHFDKVMELSRVNKMGEKLRWQTVNLQALLSEAKARRQNQLSNFEVLTHINTDSHCKGDVMLLEIALSNMLENACRYGDGIAVMEFTETKTEKSMRYQLELSNKILNKPQGIDEKGVGLGSVICDVVAKFHKGIFTLTINQETQRAQATLMWQQNND